MAGRAEQEGLLGLGLKVGLNENGKQVHRVDEQVWDLRQEG